MARPRRYYSVSGINPMGFAVAFCFEADNEAQVRKKIRGRLRRLVIEECEKPADESHIDWRAQKQ